MTIFTSYEFVVQKLQVAPGARLLHDIKNLDIYFRKKSHLLKALETGKNIIEKLWNANKILQV